MHILPFGFKSFDRYFFSSFSFPTDDYKNIDRMDYGMKLENIHCQLFEEYYIDIILHPKKETNLKLWIKW